MVQTFAWGPQVFSFNVDKNYFEQINNFNFLPSSIFVILRETSKTNIPLSDFCCFSCI